MATDINFYHECIILDACSIITLYATGRMGEILMSLPPSVTVTAYVYKEEALSILDGPIGAERQSKVRIDLQPLVEQGLLRIVIHETEAEEVTFINLSAITGPGEAATSAIAIHRNWGIVTDDRQVINLLARTAPEVQVLVTLQLVKYWADTTHQPSSTIQEVLLHIERRAAYRPGPKHHLYEWWLSYQQT